MTLEESLKALKTAFTGKSAEAEKLAAEHASVVAVNAELTQKISSLEIEAAKIDSMSKQIEELTAKLNESEKLKESAVKQIESVGKKSAAIAASVGVPAVEISPATEATAPKSNSEIWEQYIAEKDPAKKQAFYNANRTAIIAHLGIK
jgi:predicted nuclease with TOPRIM domain